MVYMQETKFINSKVKSLLNIIVLILCVSSALAQLPHETEWIEQGFCARVRIQIEQEVTLTRSAFKATMEIDNSPENVQLENLNVTIDIQNAEDQIADSLFSVSDPELTNISDLNGTGSLSPGNTAKAVWTIIPTREAAPEYPTQYFIGGTLSYTESGSNINMPLFPASITVKPDPRLELDYFLQQVVYSDDPHTKDIVEPAEPYTLGLILKNTGKGTVYDVNITSSQPQIVENEKGLLVDFKIIGTQVNTEPISPSLTVNLGDIGPAQTSVAQWMMTTSLAGKFIDYQAEFEHVDDLGASRLSLIETVNIHEIIHAVRVDVPANDYKPDFLANDVKDGDFLPDTLYNSNGSTEPVNVIQNGVINGELSSSNLEIVLTVTAPNGWIYIRADDPGMEEYRLNQVLRSDGRTITLGENAWTTHRTIRLVDYPTFRQHLLHLFDYSDGGIYEYRLIYDKKTDISQPPVLMFIPEHTISEGVHFGFIVKSSDPNGTIPSLSASSLPPGAKFTDNGNGEGLFNWATSIGDAGSYEITFTSSDGDLTDTRKATIIILSAEDEDGDNMPDEWEMNHFDTMNRDGTGDFDNDGIIDINEYLMGSDPNTILGDILYDREVDLNDVIIALQIIAGIIPDALIQKEAEINRDSRIGMEEVIFLLHNLSNSRK